MKKKKTPNAIHCLPHTAWWYFCQIQFGAFVSDTSRNTHTRRTCGHVTCNFCVVINTCAPSTQCRTRQAGGRVNDFRRHDRAARESAALMMTRMLTHERTHAPRNYAWTRAHARSQFIRRRWWARRGTCDVSQPMAHHNGAMCAVLREVKTTKKNAHTYTQPRPCPS